MELHKLAAVVALGLGVAMEGDGYCARASKLAGRTSFPPGPSPALTKRQKRRLRGKTKDVRSRAAHPKDNRTMTALFSVLAQAVFFCGYQPPDAIFCIDEYGHLKTPSAEDRRRAAINLKARHKRKTR